MQTHEFDNFAEANAFAKSVSPSGKTILRRDGNIWVVETEPQGDDYVERYIDVYPLLSSYEAPLYVPNKNPAEDLRGSERDGALDVRTYSDKRGGIDW